MRVFVINDLSLSLLKHIMEEYGDYSLLGKATVTENNLSK